jgi:DNA-binding CsgD family transcriptional regulator
MAHAEASGVGGPPDPDAWAAAASHWVALGRAHLAAYCRLRQAEGLLARRRSRVEARRLLSDAAAVAARLGAVPLGDAIADLARIARLELIAESGVDDGASAPEPVPAVPTGAATPAVVRGDRGTPGYGLTRREHDVLPLLAAGYSNRQIADALFISESTAGVHVSNILGKLGVGSRVEAAAIAVRSGLVA